LKKQHHVKKSAISDLSSSCLSLGKVAFLFEKPGMCIHGCTHDDAYTLYHTNSDTESWDSDEDIYRVNQRSDSLGLPRRITSQKDNSRFTTVILAVC
jgi:hypothetical protein